MAKGKNDFVTIFDKMSEKLLVEGLRELIPDSGFIAEEGTGQSNGEAYQWIIDPIDGTTNFVHGAPPFCISVGLAHNNVMIMGVIYDMFSNECYYSYTGGKVYLNGVECTTSPTNKVDDMLIATGFPYTDFGRLPKFMQSLTFFMDNSHGVRRLGSAAIDLAYVAVGRYDGFYEYNLNPWDVAAGAFLVQQAGGMVSDFKGGNNWLFGKEIIAATSPVFHEFRTVIGDIMN